MTATIPTTEPAVVNAGDTWKWIKNLPDYLPADGWTLSYAIAKDGAQEEFSTSDNGDGTHLVNVVAATTAGFSPGVYRWQAYVTKSSERYTVGRGEITVKADFAAQDSGFDGRSNWRTILDQLESAYKAMTAGEIKSASVAHGDRTMTYRSLEELIKAISHAKIQVQAEETAEKIQAGMGSGRKVLVRF